MTWAWTVSRHLMGGKWVIGETRRRDKLDQRHGDRTAREGVW